MINIDEQYANLTKWERAFLKSVIYMARVLIGFVIGFFIFYFIALNFILPGIEELYYYYLFLFGFLGIYVFDKMQK